MSSRSFVSTQNCRPTAIFAFSARRFCLVWCLRRFTFSSFSSRQIRRRAFTLGAEGGALLLHPNRLLSLGGRDLTDRISRGPALLHQPGPAVGLPATDPLAHRLRGAVEVPRGRLEAVLSGVQHQPVPKLTGVFAVTSHGIIRERAHRFFRASVVCVPL